MRILWFGRLGTLLMLIGAGGFPLSRYWLDTRSLTTLGSPITLARGESTTPEFPLNLSSYYYVQLAVERNRPLGPDLDCIVGGCYQSQRVVKMRWALMQGAHVIGSGSSDDVNGAAFGGGIVGRVVGKFHAVPGRYRLKLFVDSDTYFLDAGNPRIWIQADGRGYEHTSRVFEALRIVSLFICILGVYLWWWARNLLQARCSPVLEIPGGFEPRADAGAMRKLWKSRFFVGPPQFGVVASVTLLMVLIPMWYMSSWRITPRGLMVLVAQRGTQFQGTIEEPLVFRIDKDGDRFLGGKRITSETTQQALKEEFSRRAKWIVYLDVDPELDYETAVQAMDEVQTLHGTVVLVTATTRNIVVDVRKCLKSSTLNSKFFSDLDSVRVKSGERYRASPIVSFTIEPLGTVSNAILQRSSGIKTFDEAVLSGIKRSVYRARPGCPAIDTHIVVTADLEYHVE